MEGPRALHSAACLWGLGDLTPAEQEQVELANALLRTQVLLLFAALFYNVAAIMEHPAEPSWLGPAEPTGNWQKLSGRSRSVPKP